MSDSNEYILGLIKTHVWSGFYSEEDVYQMIEDVLDEDADEDLLRAAVRPEFRRKRQAEATWPTTTDCDRLDDAFAELNDDGVIALHNTGMTMSDGQEDVGQALHERGRSGIKGYCFYHGQDLERAVNGDGLWLAFGDLDAIAEQKKAVGEQIKACLERHGFDVEWNGDPERRQTIPKLDWKRRAPPE
jgi:hypothetical protein